MAVVIDGTSGITTPSVDSTGASTFTGALALPAGGLNVGSGQLAVDASGYVTMASQPVIAGQIGTALVNPITGPGLLTFNEFWVNRGISFNASTRRFTVPVAGIYRVTLNPFKIDTAAAYRMLVGVNTDTPTANTHYGHCYANGSTYETGCIDSVVTLAANDYVVFYLQAGSLYNQSVDRFNQFSIAKIA